MFLLFLNGFWDNCQEIIVVLIVEHRNVSVKELGVNECEGWLQQRCRRGSGQWNRGWFLIKGTTFYGFKHKEVSVVNFVL